MKANIAIPDTTADMNVTHLPFFVALTELAPDLSKVDQDFFDNLDPVKISDMNSLFFSKPSGEFDIYTKESNKQIFAEIVYSCARHQPKEIKLKWEIEGQVYVFNTDFSKMPVAFWRDVKRADFAEYPLDLVAFCYVEEGMTYNELDDNKNIKNDRHKRGEAFRDHISLAEYLDLQGFFLESYNVLSPFLKLKGSTERKGKRKPKKANNP